MNQRNSGQSDGSFRQDIEGDGAINGEGAGVEGSRGRRAERIEVNRQGAGAAGEGHRRNTILRIGRSGLHAECRARSDGIAAGAGGRSGRREGARTDYSGTAIGVGSRQRESAGADLGEGAAAVVINFLGNDEIIALGIEDHAAGTEQGGRNSRDETHITSTGLDGGTVEVDDAATLGAVDTGNLQ